MSLLSQILSNKKLHGIISFVLHSVNSTEHMLYSFIDYLIIQVDTTDKNLS